MSTPNNALEGAHGWYREMLAALYRALHNKEEYNYDFDRFGYGNETTFDAEWHAHFLAIFSLNHAHFYRSRTLLADAASQNLFDQLLLFRLAGHTHLRLPLSKPEYWISRNAVRNFKVGTTDEASSFGPLSIFSFAADNQQVRLKCWDGNVLSSFVLQQYYLERGSVRICPEANDTVLDLGSCFGDTAIRFALSVGEKGTVHCFDFMPRHLKIIRDNLAFNPDLSDRIHVHEFAVGAADSSPISADPTDPMAIQPGATVNPEHVPVRSIDSMTRSGEIAKVDLIKMDIEGFELAALKGAEETLRRDRPRLAISLYHKLDDFITIPQYLHELNLGYRFYLDHYTIFSEETVLYAIA